MRKNILWLLCNRLHSNQLMGDLKDENQIIKNRCFVHFVFFELAGRSGEASPGSTGAFFAYLWRAEHDLSALSYSRNQYQPQQSFKI